MNVRVLLLVCLALLVSGYRGTALYMRWVSDDLGSYLPFGARPNGGAMVIEGADYSAPGFTGRDRDGLPQRGDRVMAIFDARGHGGEVHGLFDYGAYLRPINTTTSWTLVVERRLPDGVSRPIKLSMPPAIPIERDLGQWLSDVGFDIYLPLLALVAGVIIGFLRPGDRHAWVVALAFLGFSASFRQEVVQFPPIWRELGLVLRTTAGAFTPYLLLRFFLDFPSRSVIDRRFPWIRPAALVITIVTWAAGLSLAFANAVSFQAFQRLHALFERVYMDVDRFDALATAVAVASIVTGLTASVVHAVKAGSADERRRLRIVAAGAVVGLLPMAMLYAAGVVKTRLPLPVVLASIPLIGLFPLSFIYAVVRHRVFGIRPIIRRGLQYAVLSRGFLAAEALVLFLALTFGVLPLLSRIAPDTDPKAASVGAALLTFGLMRGVHGLNQRVLPALDRRFFRESVDVRQVLVDLSRAVRQLTLTPDRLLDRVADEVESVFHPSELAVFLANRAWPRLTRVGDGRSCWQGTVGGETVRFELYLHRRRSGAGDAEPGAPLLVAGRVPLGRFLTSAAGDPGTLEVAPLDVTRAGSFASGGDLGDNPCLQDRELFDRFHTRLVVPLVTGGRPLGFVALGERRSEEPYSSEDQELLLTVAEQVAIALDYALLVDQAAEQAALKREVDVAQQVQARLFPHERPPLATLEYAGVCRAARGVGGDYYDFLALGPGRVGLAVADIAGKGLPAALLMASLQALVRSHAPSHSHDLGALAAELNRHLCESTDEAGFATLFFGLYLDSSRELRYVSAGHLEPLVLRRQAGDGARVERLGGGGMVLGVLPGQVYQEQRTRLDPGDVLLLFSDGVTEASDRSDNPFGDDRLVQAVSDHADQPAEVVVRTVLEALDRFTGAGAAQDDVTLIVAKGV